MPYMTDMRHFLAMLDPTEADQVPAPARRIAAFFGGVVEGVTAGWDDPRKGCVHPIAPRRRPAVDVLSALALLFH